MVDHAFDAVALAVEALAAADRCRAVGFRQYDGLDAAFLKVITNCIGIVGLVSEKCVRRLHRQVDQRVIGLQSAASPGVRSKARGRPLTEKYGNWNSIYRRFRRCDSCVNRFCSRCLEHTQ